MNCPCCGHDIEDAEDIIPAIPSDEDRREANIIHEFKKRTDPEYAVYAQAAEAMERAILFGSGMLTEQPIGLVQVTGLSGWVEPT